LIVLVCGGHALLEGVPGLAKTLTVKTLARICGLGFQRVQCTADLMPADVIGTNVFNLATSSFSLHRGPIFTDLLLVDEINRTTARTQAALLEAMEERQATIDGVRHSLGPNFTVFATQNPIEFEGTYPLPEAQLDRFLLKIRIAYPSAEEEAAILKRFEDVTDPHLLEQVPLEPIDPRCWPRRGRKSRSVRVEPALYQYIVSVIRGRAIGRLCRWARVRARRSACFLWRAHLAGMEGPRLS
jgi:MoxR-like ATPase